MGDGHCVGWSWMIMMRDEIVKNMCLFLASHTLTAAAAPCIPQAYVLAFSPLCAGSQLDAHAVGVSHCGNAVAVKAYVCT